MPPWIDDSKNNQDLCSAKSPGLNFLKANLHDTSTIPDQHQPVEEEVDAMERCFRDLDQSFSVEEETKDTFDLHESEEHENEDIGDDVPLEDTTSTHDSSEPSHPQTVWRQMPSQLRNDAFGYGRNPAFWFTLNFPYNYAFEFHRLQEATRELQRHTRPDQWTHFFNERRNKQWMHVFNGQPIIVT